MLNYILRRLLVMIPTLAAISFLIFFIIELPEGDYISNQISMLRSTGESASIGRLEFLRKEFALDRPFVERYGIWVGLWPGPNGFDGLIQGNWGWSFEYDQPVGEVVGPTLPLTIALNLATILFIYCVAFPIGIYSATHQYSVGDYSFTLIGYLGLATPNFLLALVLMYLANSWFGLTVGGIMEERYIGEPMSGGKALSIVAHLVVPVIVIGTSGTAAMIRRLRANLLDELFKQYVTTARSKGMRESKLLVKYPLRVALNPFIADIGNLIPSLVSGSVIVSVVLNLPTVGPVLLGALQSQDQFLAGFILLFVSILTLIGMLVSDVLLGYLDPRIRLGKEGVRQ
ncbi:peptide/nickel transport system permease protein [Pseudovibrio denitrificans]|uniref:Peptide/nickel transport system permease protein n=1 Tax=Pseudovibrio denitrificans TaxID=258256 RepID=A0A1I6YBT0_9HYPH|nr:MULTISPECIES: ABC transporter permease [Pseudovibrio]EEA94333.1 binding-protein-dependent transport systems inner membrane component [Pseudovibrio sp. JE062]SFT47953.1 peptide/nickel transport system permease protein [Pseudovibrio denitrificans]